MLSDVLSFSGLHVSFVSLIRNVYSWDLYKWSQKEWTHWVTSYFMNSTCDYTLLKPINIIIIITIISELLSVVSSLLLRMKQICRWVYKSFGLFWHSCIESYSQGFDRYVTINTRSAMKYWYIYCCMVCIIHVYIFVVNINSLFFWQCRYTLRML